MELRRVFQAYRTARPVSRTNFVHRFKISMSVTVVFSSEALYDEHKLVSSAFQ
jgi:hypothetical protein